MRVLLHITGMFVLGAVALLAAGWLFHVRTTGSTRDRPLAPLTVGTSGGTADPSRETAADRVLEGVRSDLERFERALVDGRRPDAMAALDAARRAADVLNFATGRDPSISDLQRSIGAIRHAVQNADLDGARARAVATRALLPAMSAGVSSIPPDLSPYAGATVLRPDGEIAGTIAGVAGDTVTVERGGIRDLLGFIDVRRGTTVRVAASQMIFGESRRVGATMVIAP